MKLSDHFTLNEFTYSDTARAQGIDNSLPSDAVLMNLKALCHNVLEPLRLRYGKPIRISSGYRCPKLNKAVGGVASSQHVFGQAADLNVGSREENARLFELIQDMKLPFDQLIDEYGMAWVHVSYSPRKRRQVIRKR